MACFLVPTVEAVAVGIAAKAAKSSEKAAERNNDITSEALEIKGLSISQKLSNLFKLLIGGAVLLCFEHIWHGEIALFFPFLTAMNDASETVSMLNEMATVGSTMCLIVTLVWAVICIVTDSLVKKARKAAQNIQ